MLRPERVTPSKTKPERVQFVVKGKRSSRLFFREDLAVLYRKIKALEEKRRQALAARRTVENHLPAIHNREQQQLLSKMAAEYRGIKLHLERLLKALEEQLPIDKLKGLLGAKVKDGVNTLFWVIPIESAGQVVCIGNGVKLKNVSSGAERTVMITGWRESAANDEAMPYHAPLAQALLGAKQGDVRSINGTKVSWKVVTIFSAT